MSGKQKIDQSAEFRKSNTKSAQSAFASKQCSSEGEQQNALHTANYTELWCNLPAGLRERPQWCLAGKDKAPYLVSDGKIYNASPVTGPWLSFEDACKYAAQHGHGIGYILTADDPFTCIDLDVKDAHSTDKKTGLPVKPEERTPMAQLEKYRGIMQFANSYTELSASGKGLHIWVEGDIGEGRRGGGIEVYSRERFIICTGNPVSDLNYWQLDGVTLAKVNNHNAIPIADGSLILGNLVQELGEAQKQTELVEVDAELTDEEIWRRAREADNSDKFIELCEGRWKQYGFPSQSEADLALMSMFTYYSKSNEQCRRMFRNTALGTRDKASKNNRYLDKTLKLIRGRQAKEQDRQEHGEMISKQLFQSMKLEKDEAFQGRIPRDIIKKAIPRPFQLNEVPELIANFANDVSRATGHDHSGVIMSAIAAATSVIDDRYQLEVRPGWNISARSWCVLIGGSAVGKSPCIRAGTDPIKKIHSEEFAIWNKEHAEWKKESGNKKLEEQNDPPPIRARYTSDTTIPALSDILKDVDHGLLMLTEEFSSWIGLIESSNKGDAAQSRGAWLQLRDGGRYQINRVSRGSITINNWGVSVIAACTPDGLAKQMKEMPEDGLIQRFIPCIMQSADFDALERNFDPSTAKELWEKLLRWGSEVTARDYSNVCLRFDSEAQAIFNSENKSIGKLVQTIEGFSSSYASHLGKHPGMLAEMCIIFHVFSAWETAPSEHINANTVRLAIRFMHRVRKHAWHLYSTILSASPEYTLAQNLARSIAAEKKGIATVGRDWMTQHCLTFKKANDRVRREAVQMLVDADWLKPLDKMYGGWPSKYEVNNKIFELYSSYGKKWRERRKAVSDMIKDND